MYNFISATLVRFIEKAAGCFQRELLPINKLT